MQTLTDSFAARFLRKLADYVFRYPRYFFYPQILLFIASVYYTVENLDFDMSRNSLVGADKKYHQIFLRFKEEFSSQDEVVAVVESEDMEKNRQFVERLGAKLEAEPNLFTDVIYKGDLKMLGPKALLFLSDEQLAELQRTLQNYRPFLQHFAQATNLNSLFRKINQQFRSAKPEQNEQTESLIEAIPALTRIVEQARDALNRPGTPPAPGITALFNAGKQAEAGQYLTYANGRMYLVTARPAKPAVETAAVERLRALVSQTQAEVPGVNAGVTGESVLEIDEMRQSQIDSTVATIASLIVVALIFIVGYREMGRPIKATASLIVGLGYTMGYTTLTVGHLNILTVTFLPILIGLAIDFGVHLITRFEEELRRGRTEKEALDKAMVNTGLGVFTGCFTTAGAFFAMGLTDFKGIQEMGIITGGGLLICLIPMMTFLPVLLRQGGPKPLEHPNAPTTDKRAQIERLWLERPGCVVGITVVLAGLSLIQFPKVYFDYNLLNMQTEGLPAVVYMRKLIDEASKSVLFGAVVADSLEEAVTLNSRLTNLPAVASVESMSRFLAGDQNAKLDQISRIKDEIATIRFEETDDEPVNLAELSQTLFYTQSYLGLATNEAQKAGEKELAPQLRALRQAIGDLRRLMNSRDAERNAQKLAAFQRALLEDIQQTFEALKNQDNASALSVADLPAALRNRFVGKTGKLLLQVYPKENVWQRDNQEEFVQQLRSANENVTGTPVQLYQDTSLLKESYERAAWYALGAITILVFVHFRSVTSVLLALFPVVIGTVWMVGLMGAFDIPFNPANIMTLPLVIGIGVTNGIHILNRFAEEENPSILARSTGKAVLVSALTTIAGFGSLIPAKHQGIASLGIVMSTGVATCMIAGLTFLPTLLNLLIRRGSLLKKPSADNALSTLGREEPR